MLELTVCLVCALATAGAMFAAWLASLVSRDASVADVAWGPMLALAAWGAYLAGGGTDRSLLAAVLVTAWGLRLAAHIGSRNAGEGEDRRYAKLRERAGDRFARRSLWSIFGMTVILVRITGAALLERTIADRRPEYGDYVRRTSAFVPRPPR